MKRTKLETLIDQLAKSAAEVDLGYESLGKVAEARQAIIDYYEARPVASDMENITITIQFGDSSEADLALEDELPEWADRQAMLDDLAEGNATDQAIKTLLETALTDGAHHKQWGIDQALRLLAGDSYAAIVKCMVGDPTDDDLYLGEWDEGIA